MVDKTKSCELGQGENRRHFMRQVAVGALAVPTSMAVPQIAEAFGNTDQECLELPPKNAEIFNTTCQYCMVQCGYKVHVWERGTGEKPSKQPYTGVLSGDWYSPSFIVPAEKGGKNVYIAVIPDKDCVVNKGDFSVRGGTNAQTLFSKNHVSANRRLTHPLIRKGGKGSPLEKVSWEDAIDFTAKKLIALKTSYGPDALALIRGDWLYEMPTYAMQKLWSSGIGSSSVTGNGYFWDDESAGFSAVLGTGDRSFTEDDFDQTKLLLTAGTNVQANGSVWYYRFFANNQSGKHIDVDPRRTLQGQLAEERGGLHLQIKPGTDGILFGAIIKEVLRRDAYDKDFVQAHVTGLDIVREVVQASKFDLPAASKTTWIPVNQIKRAVDLLIEHKGHSMLLSEKGIQHQMGSFEGQNAIAVLGVMLGNVGKPGAATSRAGGHPSGMLVSPPDPASRDHNKNLYHALNEGKIKAIWAFGCNMLKQMPALTQYGPKMGRTFVVVQDRVHTEMDDVADVIFPAATWGETELLQSSVTRRLRINQQFMEPPGEAKPDWWISAQVGKAMGYKGFDWKTAQDVWNELRAQNAGISEITWEMIAKAGTDGIRYPYKNGLAPERLFDETFTKINGKQFPTKDGKAHFEKFVALKKFDPRKYEWAEVNANFPLMAIDFRLNELWNTGYTYWDKPTVNARTPDAFVMIHPDDAKARGISDEEWVELKSPYGSCKGKARVTTDIAKGIVAIPALFPKKGQEFNYATRPNVSPVTGNFDTMVAAEIVKA